MSDYLVILCPKCRKKTKNTGFPYGDWDCEHYWDCEHCGYEASDSKIIYAVDLKKVQKKVDELKRLLEEFPHYRGE